MSKQKGNQGSTTGRMTVMLIQLEGDDATIQEGIRTFKETMGRVMPQVASRSIALPPAPPAIAALAGPDTNGPVNGEVETITSEVIADPSAATPSNSGGSKNSTQRSFPKMQLVKELNLRPTDKQHLKQLLDEKQPKDQNEKITLCVYYLRRVLEVENVTANHVYTCMEDARIRVPNDLPQTLRNIAARKGWLDVTNSSAIEIPIKGINLIQHDLPRAGS